ncbi:MAG: putative secreted protein [Candidatus Phytoplasma cynodontis]|uniref:hypothetical protein n=1 Tax='Cynodon dactylon' phytoplasma TaxID=295320 RepID=UPI001265D14A|nr:hypothetical protein ['Cynodon dactylon' phytoplasma]KAB8121775.1 hypothetical protein F1741_01905 ['Cynodon dactylon' phytoplasma]WIA07838.1 MAG: putative secreted protein [Candidatus Phytoplasma cynodontis]
MKKSLILFIILLILVPFIIVILFSNFSNSISNSKNKEEKKILTTNSELIDIDPNNKNFLFRNNNNNDNQIIISNSNLKNKIFEILFQTNNLEQKIKDMIQSKDVVVSNKIIATNYINSDFFQKFKRDINILNDEINNNKIIDENKLLHFSIRIENLENLFNKYIKIKILNLIDNLYKKEITKKDFQEIIDSILNEKDSENFELSKHKTFQEYELYQQYKKDNKIADFLEKDLEEYFTKINNLKKQKDFCFNKIQKLISIFETLNKEDIDSQKKLDKTEEERMIWQKKDRFWKNSEHIEFQKELDKMYVERQEKIQSLSNIKNEIEKAKSDYDYFNKEIIYLENIYQNLGKEFVSKLGKLKSIYRNLNSFKNDKNNIEDIKKAETKLKEIYTVVN